MRAQAIAIFLTVVVSLIGVSYYQVGEGVSNDAKSLGEAAARSQIAALIPAFLGEFKTINEQVRNVAPDVLGKPNDFDDNISTRFEMLARLQLNNGVWAIQQRAFHAKTKVRSWADNYTQIALKGIRPRDIPMGGTALTALLDPQRRPFFLWIVRDERDQWSSVITRTDIFQAIIDRQRGQNVSIFLVNKAGQALGHTTSEYVGTILKDDPIVAEILRGSKTQGVGLFRTTAGIEVQGLYEQVPGSNAFVVLSRPMTAMNDRIASVRLQILLMGGGLALVGLAVMMLTLKGTPPHRGPANASLGMSIPPSPLPPVSNSPLPAAIAAGAPDLAREKMKAYTTSASALAREMHGPLTRILSQAQLLKAKSINTEEVTRIEELARDGRNVVLKLLSFAGEEEFLAEPTSINEVLNRTLGIFENRFQMKGIKVEKNLKRMPEVAAHPLALMKVFEALLNNSIEAMERMPSKVLALSLEAEGANVVLKIKDSGEGIANEKAGQVFDPFFTTKNPTQHSGLGLSTAYGLVKEFGGELQFAATPGQGATVILKFPVGASASGPELTTTPMPAPTQTRETLNTMMSTPPLMGFPNLDEIPATPRSAAPVPAPSAALSTIPLNPGAPVPPAPKGLGPLPPLKPSTQPTPAVGLPPNPGSAPKPSGMPPMTPAPSSLPAASAPGSSTVAQSPSGPPTGLRSVKPPKPAPMTVNPTIPLDADLNLDLAGEIGPSDVATPAAVPQPTAKTESLIQENAINETLSLIDQIEYGPLTPTSSDSGNTGSTPPTGNPENTAFGKIDKPQFGPKKPTARVAGASVSIRKPGERK